MTINAIIRQIMSDNKVSLSRMGKALRKTDKVTHLTSADVNARLSNDNMTFDTAVQMLNALDCKIVILDNNTGETFTVDQIRKVKLM